MGMFDDIKYNGKWYQSKSFDCEMDSYEIDKGRLYRLLWKREDLPESEWTEFLGIVSKTRMVANGREDMEFHGIMRFYDSKETYRAKFTDGNLVGITLLPEETEE